MKLERNQRVILKLLEREGVVENLGNTYRNFTGLSKQSDNAEIMSFVEEVKNIHPNTTLVLGKKGGLWTATLSIR